ncbi:MAG: hypothetical protein AAFQ22_12595, partial [Pseudomonadota bacterium]
MAIVRFLVCLAAVVLASSGPGFGQEAPSPGNTNTPINPFDPNAPPDGPKTNLIAPGDPIFGGSGVPVPYEEWEQRQNADERLTAFGTDILGDGIDPHTGSIVFTHTDVSLPGNSALPVTLTRKRAQGYHYHWSEKQEFGDWQYVVPRITVTSMEPWVGNRCSNSFAQNFPVQPTSTSQPGVLQVFTQATRQQYSQGLIMDVPGQQGQHILEAPASDKFPANATHATSSNFYLYCGSASDGGEGFIAVGPNGDTYRFDRYISRRALNYGTIGGGYNALLERSVEILAATEVTDVHGNWVRYDYDTQ